MVTERKRMRKMENINKGRTYRRVIIRVMIPRRSMSRINTLLCVNDTYNPNEICEYDILTRRVDRNTVI